MIRYEQVGDSSMKTMYYGAFGIVEVPRDIYLRAWRWRDSRPDYLAEWANYQSAKAAR